MRLFRILSFSLLLIVAASLNLIAQDWELQAEGLASRWQAIDAVDSNIAVAAAWSKHNTGEDAIYRTLDGGKTWHQIPWNAANFPVLIDISIIDSANIWVVSNSAICHTSDAGQTWEVQFQIDSTRIYVSYIEMFDSLNGIAEYEFEPGINMPVQILKTTDGGKIWINQNHSYLINRGCCDFWRGIDFVSPDIGYGRFSYAGVPLDTVYLQKTTDGGQTWQNANITLEKIHAIRFYDENSGIGTYPYNKPVWRTLDGGETWESFPIDSHDGWPNDIEFFPGDPARVFAVFGWYLFFSNDTGRTWTEIPTPFIRQFRDIAITDSRHAWIVGEGGIIHTSTGGGATSVSENEPTLPKKFALFQNFPNPFNSYTSIRFSLKQKDIVSLKIYNLAGKEVAVLLDKKTFSSGNHAINFDAGNLASGIYLYCLECSQGKKVRRMVLLR